MLTPEMLRAQAARQPSPFDPFWVAEAQRLLLWAADSLEAAQAVIDEHRPRMEAEASRAGSDAPVLCPSHTCTQCSGMRYTADGLPCTACNAMGEIS